MSSKSKKRRPQVSLNKAIRSALTMFLWAYCNVHDPDFADMENMSHEIQSVVEGVRTGRLKLWEIEEALKEERGWQII